MASYGQVIAEGIAGLQTAVMVFVPLLLLAIAMLIMFFFMRRSRVFNIECRILSKTADHNLVEGSDKGGIIRRPGIEEFRLLRRKKSMPIPDRKFWILNEKGRFTIYFYRHSEDDFEPINPRIVKKGVKALIKNFKKNVLNQDDEHYKKIKEGQYEALDVKGDLSEVYFDPVKADSKHFHAIKGRELLMRHDTTSKLERLLPIAGYAFIGVVLIFLVIWYFQAAEKVATNGFDQSERVIAKANEVLERMAQSANSCSGSGGSREPSSNIDPPDY